MFLKALIPAKHKLVCLLVLGALSITGCRADSNFPGLISAMSDVFSQPHTVPVNISPLDAEQGHHTDWYQPDAHTLVIRPGAQLVLKGSATIKDGTQTRHMHWKSSDPAIMEVHQGRLMAHRMGEAMLTASAVLDAQATGHLTIIVKEFQQDTTGVSKVQIETQDTPDKRFWLQQAEQGIVALPDVFIALNGVITHRNGTVNGQVIWESSDPQIATVNSQGQVTTRGYGTTTIVAKARQNPEYKALITLQVVQTLPDTAQKNTSQSVQPAETAPSPQPAAPTPVVADQLMWYEIDRSEMSSLQPGQRVRLRAYGYYASGQKKEIAVTWLSQNPLVASVSADGYLVCYQPGFVILTAQYSGALTQAVAQLNVNLPLSAYPSAFPILPMNL